MQAPPDISFYAKQIEHLKEELEETRGREKMLLYIFEKSLSSSILIEEDMTISLSNEKVEELFGYRKNELQGKVKWPIFIHQDDVAKMKAYHQLRREDPSTAPSEYECRMIDGNGKIQDVFLKLDMIPGTKKSLATFITVTSRKQAEKSLLERESQLSAVVNNFEGFIYTVDSDYSLEFMNARLIKRVGREACGEKCHSVIFSRSTPCPWCPLLAVANGKTVKQEIIDPIDGRWHAWVSTPISGGDPGTLKKQTLITDIHDRKLAEAALLESRENLKVENRLLKSSMKDRYRFGSIIGRSPKMQAVYELIIKAASSGDNVIIYGESGTGKELVAREIHELSGSGKTPFVPVNCGAIPENLMESEFFGYKKGAFSGAIKDKPGYLDQADGGVIFLDELGEIPLAIQVKLLRAIDGGGFIPIGGSEVKTPELRIIAATNRDLISLVKNGTMRADFFYRIHVIPILLPPLRDRKEDIPLLMEHFLKSIDSTVSFTAIEPSVVNTFQRYSWPGNIREMQNALRRYLTLGQIDLDIHGAGQVCEAQPLAGPKKMADRASIKAALNDTEKQIIIEALEKNRWHRGYTALSLGMTRKTLERRMKQYDIRGVVKPDVSL
ncbi:sigma 54-interacting transcriptional regulator [Desulforegula conservatrix]|uniref:sigma 54-interacting transcriptional regulator n=1 Tax=Desulforegula conservatrix TaxID=153026 RepID=UPI000429CDD1|nr:sigma 54-interacting transcriptional regulator [Desulforegula conservatrix]